MGQYQECGLEGVFGVVTVAEDAPADAKHHRTMPVHQLLERRLRGLVAAGDEPVQELRVRQRPERAQVDDPVDLPEQAIR